MLSKKVFHSQQNLYILDEIILRLPFIFSFFLAASAARLVVMRMLGCHVTGSASISMLQIRIFAAGALILGSRSSRRVRDAGRPSAGLKFMQGCRELKHLLNRKCSQGLCGPQLTCQKQGADQFPTCVKMKTHCIDAQTKYDEVRSPS